MPYMYSEMQNKLSKSRESPLESMGQIISSRAQNQRADFDKIWYEALEIQAYYILFK